MLTSLCVGFSYKNKIIYVKMEEERFKESEPKSKGFRDKFNS